MRHRTWVVVATAASVAAAIGFPAPADALDPGTITTMAGGPGTGPALEVAQTPRAIQAAGNSLYVLDVDPEVPPLDFPYSGVIRRINLTTGAETVVAGDGRIGGGFRGDGGDARLARFANPQDIAVDPAGNIFVADFANNRIRRIGTNGIITTVAGGPARGFAGDGGPASDALIDGPNGIATDNAGRVYFYDRYNWRVRRIDTDGTITTVAGNGTPGSAGDNGPAIAAQLTDVRHLEVDSAGILYLPDLSENRIRRVVGGVITTMSATSSFSVAAGDTPGSLFSSSGYGVVKILADGTVVPVSGSNDPGYVDGPVASARFGHVRSVARAGGPLFVGDYTNRRVREIAGGTVSTIAGNGTTHDGGDGRAATDAQMSRPSSIATMPDGGVVVIDTGNNRVRRIKADGTIVAFAGSGERGFSGDGGPATAASLDHPVSVAVEPDGSVLITDGLNYRIRRVSPGGVITTAAGTGAEATTGDGGPATAAAVVPGALAVGADGTIYFGDRDRIRSISPGGIITTLMGPDGDSTGNGLPVGSASPGIVWDIAVLPDGLFWTTTHRIRRLDPCGRVSTVASLTEVRGLARDPAGNLFATQTGYVDPPGVRIERVSRIAVDGTVTVLAGTDAADLSGDGGPATAAALDAAWDIAVLPNGDIAIGDRSNDRVRRVAGVAATISNGAARPCWSPPPPPPTTTTTTTPATPSPTPQPAPAPLPAPPPRSGYWMVAGDGSVYGFGDARHFGAGPPGSVDLEPAPDGNGYWVVDGAGAVWARGSAGHFGGATGSLARGETITSLSATPSGRGYWLFTSAGRALPFGDAPFLGDMRGTRLNGPVLDSIPTRSGRGYYMVASDGGIFAFGDAAFRGSMGGRPLNAPVQSLVPAAGGGYWLVASDGGVFAFDAPFRGSMGGTRLNRPVTGMVAFGNGYLMVGEDGGIFNFSDRPFHGSLGASPPPVPVVAVAALPAA